VGAAAVLLGGCGKPLPEESVVGTWVGDPPLAAELRQDPLYRQFVEALQDSVQLQLKDDHTYVLETWARKSGKWKILNNLILFEERDSRSPFGAGLEKLMEFGKLDSKGNRTYSAVLSKEKSNITLLMGANGEVVFHR
jgi:hypothetical protein